MIANKYSLLEKISEGCFGTVYKAINNRTNELVAIKLEAKNDTIKSLKNEAKIYQYLGKVEGFPQLKTFGTIDKSNYLVMNLLGKSLENVINYYKSLSFKTVLVLGSQIINRIKYIHEKGLLHRDIKPSNFLFGINSDTNKLHLVDFGFSKRYDYNGNHIEEKQLRHIIGSVNFVSLNVHKLIEPSRRDDIESCIYIILTMLFGRLDWFNKTELTEIETLKNHILLKKEVPTFITNLIHYVRQLKFNDPPDYDYIINTFITEYDMHFT